MVHMCSSHVVIYCLYLIPVGFPDVFFTFRYTHGVKTINMSLKLLLLFATVLGLCCGETLGPELLVNPGFESPDFDGNWYCNGCTLRRSTDAIEGEYSAKITDRYLKLFIKTQKTCMSETFNLRYGITVL